MKLRKLLKLFDMFDTNIIVWKPEDDEEEPAYRGFLCDMPYWLLDMTIVGDLCTAKYVNEHGVTFGTLVVEVKDGE
jgi:hypothetical protein